jgi:hypothetical protein
MSGEDMPIANEKASPRKLPINADLANHCADSLHALLKLPPPREHIITCLQHRLQRWRRWARRIWFGLKSKFGNFRMPRQRAQQRVLRPLNFCWIPRWSQQSLRYGSYVSVSCGEQKRIGRTKVQQFLP